MKYGIKVVLYKNEITRYVVTTRGKCNSLQTEP